MSHDDFATEPVPGLPETPPEGERILWQGRPSWWRLAVESLSLPWVAAYFAGLALWRFLTIVDLAGAAQAFALSVPFLILGAICCALLVLFAWVQARATVYTITNCRVAMRTGAALQVTLNLPYIRIAQADLDLRRGGTGTVALTLTEASPLSYAMGWPHVRPWSIRQVKPALRCIPDAERVARLLAVAAETRLAVPEIRRRPDAASVAAE